MCKVVGVTDKVRPDLCVSALALLHLLPYGSLKTVFFVPKVLIVQSMVNKETFVVKVSPLFSSTGLVLHRGKVQSKIVISALNYNPFKRKTGPLANINPVIEKMFWGLPPGHKPALVLCGRPVDGSSLRPVSLSIIQH